MPLKFIVSLGHVKRYLTRIQDKTVEPVYKLFQPVGNFIMFKTISREIEYFISRVFLVSGNLGYGRNVAMNGPKKFLYELKNSHITSKKNFPDNHPMSNYEL